MISMDAASERLRVLGSASSSGRGGAHLHRMHPATVLEAQPQQLIARALGTVETAKQLTSVIERHGKGSAAKPAYATRTLGKRSLRPPDVILRCKLGVQEALLLAAEQVLLLLGRLIEHAPAVVQSGAQVRLICQAALLFNRLTRSLLNEAAPMLCGHAGRHAKQLTVQSEDRCTMRLHSAHGSHQVTTKSLHALNGTHGAVYRSCNVVRPFTKANSLASGLHATRIASPSRHDHASDPSDRRNLLGHAHLP